MISGIGVVNTVIIIRYLTHPGTPLDPLRAKRKLTTFTALKKVTNMSGQITFTMIKPGAVKKSYTGAILDKIVAGGFHIAAMKMVQLTIAEAEGFYAVHRERPFFPNLVEFMASGPIVLAVLQKDNAVEDFRKLIGATDPAKAEIGTIRKLYGDDLQSNAVHGSDSDANAEIEASYFFATSERFLK
jgi:nucleoside-diphosphate kinase